MLTRRDRQQAATVLRAVLEAVDAGELEAKGEQGQTLVRHLEGVVTALDVDLSRSAPSNSHTGG